LAPPRAGAARRAGETRRINNYGAPVPRRAGGTARQTSAFTIISYAPPCVKSAAAAAGEMMGSFAVTSGKVLEEKLFSAIFKKMMKKA